MKHLVNDFHQRICSQPIRCKDFKSLEKIVTNKRTKSFVTWSRISCFSLRNGKWVLYFQKGMTCLHKRLRYAEFGLVETQIVCKALSLSTKNESVPFLKFLIHFSVGVQTVCRSWQMELAILHCNVCTFLEILNRPPSDTVWWNLIRRQTESLGGRVGQGLHSQHALSRLAKTRTTCFSSTGAEVHWRGNKLPPSSPSAFDRFLSSLSPGDVGNDTQDVFHPTKYGVTALKLCLQAGQKWIQASIF